MNLAITGATSGIGTELIKALEPMFSKLFLLVRDTEKARQLVRNLSPKRDYDKFEVIHCDLSDLHSVSKAGDLVSEKVDVLHVLVNNAGGIFPKGALTKNGLETTFQVNHLGHFLLTTKLLPLLKTTAEARIINVSSEAHKAANPDFTRITSTADYKSFAAYANAKLCNILFTRSIHEKFGDEGVLSFSLHPGVVRTNFGGEYTGIVKAMIKLSRIFMISPKKGAETAIFLASSPTIKDKGGRYFKKSKPANTSKKADSQKLKDELWELSKELIHDYL